LVLVGHAIGTSLVGHVVTLATPPLVIGQYANIITLIIKLLSFLLSLAAAQVIIGFHGVIVTPLIITVMS